jgi:hypothetical protein
MQFTLQDVVKFRGDRLFHGAVNIDWFLSDEEKRRKASEAFVFHGPKYHGVSQDDVGHAHGHRLIDTASFAQQVIRRCCGLNDQPFTLAIAGYGTGKSHLALTLATLLAYPSEDTATTIVAALQAADPDIGDEIQTLLRKIRPCLVIALNGMRNFDLTAEVTRQVILQLRARNLDTRPIEELRPRFRQAANLIRMAGKNVIAELLAETGMSDVEDILSALEEQDEYLYGKVQDFFTERGMPIRALGGESVREVIDVLAREYCGDGKPFMHTLIMFDEFGRYTEFATVRSQIAGSGVLQDLFEGVQENADTTTFIGFIQFELNAYVQRVAPEYKNDILRYITRYQSASKVYLSINLETLIAHLLEKEKIADVDSWFDDQQAIQESGSIVANLHNWFPQSRNYRLWSDIDSFHTIVRKGCWPLSPFTTWFLFSLTAAGKYLQERSALALLGDFFQRSKEKKVKAEKNWTLSPVCLWTDDLLNDLISSEESGQQGTIAQAYATVYSRYGSRISTDGIRLLQAIVLSSKMGLQVNNRDEAIVALTMFAGLPVQRVQNEINLLQNEYNLLEWDERFNQFDILGDSVPRTQFLSFLRQRVANTYDENGKAKLFASKASKWCDLLGDLECDFAEKNSITTTEWRYQGVLANLETLDAQIRLAADRWTKAISINEPRGTVIYCYVEQNRDPQAVASNVKKMLRTVIREFGIGNKVIPILVILLCDEEGILGQALAELAVLEDNISEEDRARFGNLIGAHQEKMRQVVQNQVEELIKQRRYITALQEEIQAKRISRVGTELFERIYKRPLPFPFDGFKTARGNAADSCQELILDLLRGSLDYDAVISKPVKVKNRALTTLRDSWDIFTMTGKISRRPKNPVVRKITEEWDNILQSDHQQLCIGKALRKLCLPPYGANIASAGLLLGVFVAPRSEQLVIIRDGQQYALTQWLQEGIFKKKFLDINALQNVELAFIGEASSEWENLLDEWEQAESYTEKFSFLKKALELKSRIPVPPICTYRFIHLEEQAHNAANALNDMEKQQDEAFRKLEAGEKQKNIGLLSWGAVTLLKLKEKMITEMPLWEKHQIAELEPHIERTVQMIVQLFPTWLADQRPVNDAPDAVGDFKYKMFHLVGNNLKALGLTSQLEELEKHTKQAIRQAETFAEANQLIRDTRAWLDQHIDALRLTRVAEIRGLKDVGKKFSARLQGMSRRIEMKEISTLRVQLNEFLTQLQEAESNLTKRAFRLWNSKISTEEELDKYIDEVDSLIRAFEGCETDVEDLRIMKQALQAYKFYYNQLCDDNLSWQEFASLAEKLRQEAKTAFEAEEAVPWSADDVFKNFVSSISTQRKQRSLAWIESIEANMSDIDKMSVGEANRLLSKAVNPPAILTDEHTIRLSKVVNRIEEHLESLTLEWLIEKFKELPKTAQKKFIEKISEVVNGLCQ